jgi:hypothetical protein
MPNVVEAATACRPEIGDFVGGDKYYVRPVKDGDTAHGDYIYLNFRSNPWSALQLLGVDTTDFQKACTYRCPFVEGNRYYAAIPVCLRVACVAPYRVGRLAESGFDYVFDTSFTRSFMGGGLFKPNSIMRTMMGHGYRDCALPCDGSGDIKYYWAGLDNEDTLYCAVWEWYNK